MKSSRGRSKRMDNSSDKEKELERLKSRVVELMAEKKALEKYISLLEKRVLTEVSPDKRGSEYEGEEAGRVSEEELVKELKKYSLGELVRYAIEKDLLPRGKA